MRLRHSDCNMSTLSLYFISQNWILGLLRGHCWYFGHSTMEFKIVAHTLNSSVIIVDLLDKGKNCKRLLQRHVIFYEETFSSKIKNIDSSFSKLVYSFHSTYQEREIEPSMKREKTMITDGLNHVQLCWSQFSGL